MIKYFLFFSIIIILLYGCSQPVEIREDQPPAGTYGYKGFDSTGVLIVEGIMTLSYSDSVTINGTWNFNGVGSPDNIGPQTGQGKLIGGYDNRITWIQLNPNFADNNIGLSGSFKDNVFRGNWEYSTFIGPVNKGNFSAELK